MTSTAKEDILKLGGTTEADVETGGGEFLAEEFRIPEGARQIDLRELLFFNVGDMRFCLPMVEILSIVNVSDVFSEIDLGIDLPPIVQGFIRFRRQEIPLLDLRPKLGLEKIEEIPEEAEGLLIDFGVTFLGLWVDYVYNVEDTQFGYGLDLPAGITDLGNEFLHEYVVYPGGGAYRLSVGTLLDDDDIGALSDII